MVSLRNSLEGAGGDIYEQLSEFPINLLLQQDHHRYKNFTVLKDIEQYRSHRLR
jgi:hypothetical protein